MDDNNQLAAAIKPPITPPAPARENVAPPAMPPKDRSINDELPDGPGETPPEPRKAPRRRPDPEPEPDGKRPKFDASIYDIQEPGTEQADGDDGPPASKPAAPAKVEFSPYLIAEAVQAGFTEDEVKEFTSPKQLQLAVAKTKRPEPAKGGDPKAEEKKELPKDEFDAKFWEDEGVSEKVVERFKAEHEDKKALRKEMAEMKTRLDRHDQAAADKHQETLEADMDAGFQELNKTYGNIFGSDPGRKLDPESRELRKRVAIFKEMDDEYDREVKAGRRPPENRELQRRAADNLWGQDAGEDEPAKRPGRTITERARDGTIITSKPTPTARPSQRHEQPLEGEAGARQVIRRHLETAGQTNDQNSLRDGLLD